MKKVKGKYIRLTEEELKRIIKEEVGRELSLIMEYALPRSKFIDNAFNLSQQIIENWCLVHYCTIIGRTNTKEHWKSELYAHMDNVSKNTIKKNNSLENRKKAFVEAFDYNDLFTTPDRIIRLTLRKFIKEHIDTKSEEYIKCVNDCFNSVNDIIDVLADGDVYKIGEYIESI